MGVKFRVEDGPLLHAKFHSHRCNVSPLQGENPQNRPLSKLNTGRFALQVSAIADEPTRTKMDTHCDKLATELS